MNASRPASPVRVRLGVAAVVVSTFVALGTGCQVVAGVDFDAARLAEDRDGSTPGDDDEGAGDGRPGEDDDTGTASSSGSPDAGGTSACVPDATWCNNRCGQTQDNCGRSIDCGTCPGSAPCTNNSCGCSPEPLSTTCNGVACGPKVNNCGQTVICPDTCTSPNVCNGGSAGPNGCGCTPNDACGARCSGTVTNNCGQTITCSRSCGLAGACPCAGGFCSGSGFCDCNPGPCR